MTRATCTEQSMNDRHKIAREGQVNNCDIRIDRDMCTFVIMYCTCKCIYIPEYPYLRPPLNPLAATQRETVDSYKNSVYT